ncbi:hypothetical protein FOB72_17240 (plasmid) [Cupriavidus pauculus]|uniref:DUF4760 domain-containing protein n=1 Tax=Cupriavidus pauculus TaxID=82633 RepID=A0A5P2H764_9BURK|nr:putative phage abortive infection protein [Cupriavidus pauculus]QET03912.1 hypothetical protein FOB72_17240 [Cupriavidus pauculus]
MKNDREFGAPTLSEMDDEDGSNDLKSAAEVFRIVIYIAISVVAAYALNFISLPFSEKGEAWGQFGDFIGGTINPVVGLATVYLVLVTVKLQRRELQASLRELRISNKALAKQGFENSFFSWLNSYHKLLDSIQLTISNENAEAPEKIYIGRHALKRMHVGSFTAARVILKDSKSGKKLPTFQRRHRSSLSTPQDPLFFSNWSKDQRETAINMARDGYETVFDRHRYQLDGMFRTLFRLIKWVDESDPKIISREEKWQYIAIIRAQLSWIELVFLVYNCMTQRGEPFIEYANKYALFDNLGTEADGILILIRADPVISGIAASAFSSDIARKQYR